MTEKEVEIVRELEKLYNGLEKLRNDLGEAQERIFQLVLKLTG